MKIFLVLCAALILPALAAAQEEGEKFFLVSEYRYEAQGPEADQDTGHSLCGTRCNALSTDYRSVMEVEGWNLIELSKDQEVVVDLNNPFLSGRCICVGSTYLAKKIAAPSRASKATQAEAGEDQGRKAKSGRRWYMPAL